VTSLAEKYLRTKHMPHIWCPGCGHGTALGALFRAMEEVGVDQDRTVIVSGIGCSSRAPGYMDFDTLHTTHGRALAFATGVRVARPELRVIVIAGDGDLAAIGGNHFIHAARRNLDITTICFNNNIYGMTSGQYSPMTPQGKFASTAPYGNADRDFDLCALAQAAGATYVSRATTYHVRLLIKLLVGALEHKGFSFVETLSQCPTQYGRRNKLRTPRAMLEWFRDNAVTARAAEGKSPEGLAGRFVIGKLFEVQGVPEYMEVYQEISRKAQQEGRGSE